MNQFVERCIRQPVLTSALSFLILLIGVFSLFQLPVRFLPRMNQAIITIDTPYPGVDALIMKNFITAKIQNALVGIVGIDYLTSSNKLGLSEITLYLTENCDPDTIISQVISKVSSSRTGFPSSVEPSIVAKKNLDNRAMLILSFSGSELSRVAVADYLRKIIVPQIESISGVSQAEVWGDQYAMNIYLDPHLLAMYHLVPQDIATALKMQNVISGSGAIQGDFFNYHLSVATSLHTADDFNQIIIKMIDQRPIYLHDVGFAKMGAEEDQFMVFYNNQPATFLGVFVLPEANPLSVIKKVLNKLPQIMQDVPTDLKMKKILDRTEYIFSALNEMQKTLFESIMIVLIIIFIFLGNIRAAIIPIATIPLSLLGVCFLMNTFAYSINTITLLSMVLAVSLVVDDAIVIVENIMRHMHSGELALNASIVATQELLTPIIAMTITLVAVYLPIGFTGGLMGALFGEFCFTLALSVIISGFLAVTLSPMMAAFLFKKNNSLSFGQQLSQRMMDFYLYHYRCLLTWVFKYQKWLLFIWCGMMVASVLLYCFLPKELSPHENMGFLITQGELPVNANRHYAEHYALAANKIYHQLKEVSADATILAPQEGILAYLIVAPGAPLHDVMKLLSPALEKLSGVAMHLIPPSLLPSSGPAVQLVLSGSYDYKILTRWAKIIEERALQSGKFSYLTDDLYYSQPQANVEINSQILPVFNTSMLAIADTLSLLLSHIPIQQFSFDDQSHSVLMKIMTQDQLNPEDLLSIAIPTNDQTPIPLSSVAKINYTVVPLALNQFQKMNSVTISGEMNSAYALSQGLSFLNYLVATDLPKSITIDYAGSSRQFYQEAHRIDHIFLLALLIIFLVLAMQFDSYCSALIILLGSVPMALFSALVILKLSGLSINIYTQIALLTLIGLISKHGILMVRFANQISETQKLTPQSAIIEAALWRCRPIIMTTLAMVFAALPLIFSSGAGVESRHAIGLVIVFGIGFGTVLTLLWLPVIYLFFSSLLQRDALPRASNTE